MGGGLSLVEEPTTFSKVLMLKKNMGAFSFKRLFILNVYGDFSP